MIKINLNKLAQQICTAEGGKIEVNIAQVKDVLRAAIDVLASHYYFAGVVKRVKRAKKKGKRK